MDYRKIASQLGDEFVSMPYDFVTEVDLQVRLVQLLEETLENHGTLHATLESPQLTGSARSYKRVYKEWIEERMAAEGRIGRVHTEVSVKQGNRFDVTVFKDTVSLPIRWVSTGSKRFDEQDLEAVFELKYIKNKTYFPIEWSIQSDRILNASTAELQDRLDKTENKILGDLTELKQLPDTVETYFILFSNNNYLFHGELSEAERTEEKKIRVGQAATEWIAEESGSSSVLYTHPLESTWLTN